MYSNVMKGTGERHHISLRPIPGTNTKFYGCIKGLRFHSHLLRVSKANEREQSCFIRALAEHSSGASKVLEDKNPLSVEDNTFRVLLEEGPPGMDFASKVLRNNPSQVEPRYLIGDRLYSLREKQLLKAPFWKKIATALQYNTGLLRNKKSHRQSIEIRDQDENLSTSAGKGQLEEPIKSVYLHDLLREYKGELYVPEEAFKDHASELDDFNKTIDTLPTMTLEDFLKAVKSNQVELLTSRGILASSKYSYQDFIVNLRPIPGDQRLHTTQWAMHLTETEAEIALKEYSGRQVEIETQYTPYVVPPPSAPNPVASSISGKVMLELTVASGLIATMAFTIGSFVGAMTFMGLSIITAVLVYVVFPVIRPVLWPFQILLLKLIQGLGILLFGGFTSSTIGKRGLPGLISSIYRFLNSGSLFSNVRLLGAIVFVAGCMAGLARFTLTRRPKDFTKWDLWQAIEFGQSKPQARVEGSTGVLFSDIAGIDDVVEELQELVNYLKNPERFNQMGTKPPHGVLMEGPPGCGKTLLAKAIAGEAGVPFYQMAGSEFVEVLVGVGAARVRDLFKRAKVNRPSVVFIDEIDALGAMRQGGDGDELEEYNAGSQERETTLNQLLIELDGFDTGKGVVFLGATNRMDMLDPALLRPGRFDRKITVKPPRAKGRFDILKVHSKNVKLSPDVDLWSTAKNLPGWSGAELAQLLQEAAMMAVRNGHPFVFQKDLNQAIDRITVGPERLGVGRGLPVHRRMATHEIGLAMTSHLLRRLEGAKLEYCERISILPRGETLSRTVFERLDDEAYFFERRPQLLHRMQVLLGGRAAEEVIFGRDTSTWSLPYLSDASYLARKLITIWNLEGPMTIRGEHPAWSREPHFCGPPLDFEGWLYDDYDFTEPTLNYSLDNDVAKHSEALVNKMYLKTLTLLRQHHAALTKAIYVLLDRQEMHGYELDLILDSYLQGSSPELVENEVDPAALPTNQASLAESIDSESPDELLVSVQVDAHNQFDNWVEREVLQRNSDQIGEPLKNRDKNGNGEVR